MYRLFVGLDLSSAIKSQLENIQSGVEGARWRPIENFHLTLAFLGAADRHQYADAVDALANINALEFDLRLIGTGFFGDRKPKALWAGVEPSRELNLLQAKVETSMRDAGFELERRKFMPHITLAYLKATTREQAMLYCGDHGLFSTERFPVTEFHLFSSQLGKTVSAYTIEASYALSSSK
ncbi:RNA 2',3'-cyclic phosphodiesterase [Hyphococcus lacteus]|uniref:RNA 2',3'-cyclic phosphodiesterase n=1 Tax=Hyphococcus lacteus TaxID=3143536 RepID=A0ABV3Z5M0_9PROT